MSQPMMGALWGKTVVGSLHPEREEMDRLLGAFLLTVLDQSVSERIMSRRFLLAMDGAKLPRRKLSRNLFIPAQSTRSNQQEAQPMSAKLPHLPRRWDFRIEQLLVN